MNLTRPQRTLLIKSTFAEKLNIDFAPIVIDEITLIGSRCGPFEPALHALAEKKVDVKPLITKVLPLRRGVEAFDIASESETVKVLLKVAP